MNLRPVITLLLMITPAASTMGLAPQTTDEPPAAQGDEKITPEEEREAREIAALLTKRWQETEDISPLIKEFFVEDFADRLCHEPQMLFFGELKPELLVPENSDDLRRHYVAMTDFMRLINRLYKVYESINVAGEEQKDPQLMEIIPARVLDVLRSNPTMDALLKEEMEEKAEGQSANRDEDVDQQANVKIIKTIEQLRSLTDALARADVLLRDHLKTLPSTLPASEMMMKEQPESDGVAASTTENKDPLMPRVYILDEHFYGYPAGTRLICMNLPPFHVDLVRVKERLKVLSIYIQGD